jgi:hypothetical protein
MMVLERVRGGWVVVKEAVEDMGYVDVTGTGLCPVSGFGFSGVEPSRLFL